MLDFRNLPFRFQGEESSKGGEEETELSGVLACQNLSTRQGKRSLHLLAKLWHFVG